jgi:YVTN family beta-propeller protein
MSSIRPVFSASSSAPRLALLGLLVLVPLVMGAPCQPSVNNHEAVGHELFTSPQVNPIVLSADGSRLYVANTTSNTVSVIATGSQHVLEEIPVGIDPVALAIRPDGMELWVSNHVSDSVSVIDLDPLSDTQHQVIATIQELGDPDGQGIETTVFDEPAGIAFASNAKAFVALSSRNDIAVVDVASRAVLGRIHITAQEPRAIAVRNGLLFVAAFESFNQSELSICPEGTTGGGPNSQCTLDLNDLVDFIVSSPNLPGADVRIVVDPDVPDRDLYVYDATDDVTPIDQLQPLSVVSGVGTLLYGLTVDSASRVFVAQTDARNAENGGKDMDLIDLDNRMFLNQIAEIDCNGGSCGSPTIHELEPAPPGQPTLADALARPYGIAVSGDDTTLVATAAGTSRVFTVDASSGSVLDILDLDAGVPADAGQQIPRGVALQSDGGGAPATAYVLNTLENTVSVVDVSNPNALVHVAKIAVGSDPTPDAVRRGRIAFNNAFASTSATFSCAGCHPDGNTDQLLWRIGGSCSFGACSGHDEPRTTMPVSGLRNTLPLHWDGSLGDPFDGPNGAVGLGGNEPKDCTLGDADGDLDCFRDLVDASLTGVMCDQSSCSGGELTSQERDDMSSFLAATSYPPPRARPLDNTVSARARRGFEDFFLNQNGLGNSFGIRSCADMDSGCHNPPFGTVDDSSTLGAFDAPTMRGMTDRVIHFSNAITAAEEVQEFVKQGGTITIGGVPIDLFVPPANFQYDSAEGLREKSTWGTAFAIFNPVYNVGPRRIFQMLEEASTGYSGAIGRQVTLNADTASGGAQAATEALLGTLEEADADGFVNLRAEGAREVFGFGFQSLQLSYRAGTDDYRNANDSQIFTRADLITAAQQGTMLLTLTAELRSSYGNPNFPQPLIFPNSEADRPGTAPFPANPAIPFLPADDPFTVTGVEVRQSAKILVDGRPAAGSISCVGGSFTPFCDSEEVQIDLDLVAEPLTDGVHLLQLQNPAGPLGNELPICVGTYVGDCV